VLTVTGLLCIPQAGYDLSSCTMPCLDVFSLQLSTTQAWPLRVFSPAEQLSTFYPRRGVQSSFMTTTNPPNSTDSAPMKTTTATTVPQMPLELVLSFIEAACAGDDYDDHIPLLMACSLVCKTWSAAAQKLLFGQVTLRSQISFQLFMNAIDRTTPHGHMLGESMKRMRVVLDHNQPSSLHHHSFALAVTMCPNLRALDISLYGCAEPGTDIVGVPDVSRLRRSAPSFDEQTISLLKSGPEIQSLQFNNWSENQQSLFQLLDIWPSIQYLSIGGTAPQHIQDSPTPFQCALRGLSLNFQNAPSVEFMRWLLHKSSGSLRTLNLERDPCIDTFEYLVNTVGPRLRSLRLPGFVPTDYAVLIAKCTNLQELQTENPSLLSAYFKKLPHDLQHLGFGLSLDTPLQVIIALVKARDSLKTIKVQLWEGGRKHELFSSLKIACAYRGVDLTITKDLRVFRSTTLKVCPSTLALKSRSDTQPYIHSGNTCRVSLQITA